MKRYPNYRIPIVYMLLYTILILASGVWLFLLSQGLDAMQEIGVALERLVYTPASKSWHNLLEVATPHLFAIGTLIFIVAHFLLFNTQIAQRWSMGVATLLMFAALFDIGVYVLIILGVTSGGILKIAAMAIFLLLFIVLLGMVLFSL